MLLRIGLALSLCVLTPNPPALPATPALPTPDPVFPIPEQGTPHHVPSYWVWAKVTAYDAPCEICCPGGDGHTSIGVDVAKHPYGIAADPGMLPYGTMIHVPGYLNESYPGGYWPVDDTGAAMRSDARHGIIHIDLRYKSHAWARQQGVRWMWIEILGD